MESIFGSMTITGWKDATDRHKLELAFYDRVLERLSIQGHRGITRATGATKSYKLVSLRYGAAA